MAETTVKKGRSVAKANKALEVVQEEVIVKTEELTTGIIAIDNGGYNTKIFSETMEEPFVMPSQKGLGHSKGRQFQGALPEGSYDVEWNGKHYFFGLLMRDSRLMTSYTNTKATPYFTLSALLGVALYGYDINNVITCVPYKRYTETEINAIKEELTGNHTLFINGEEYSFEIQDVLVVSEELIIPYGYEVSEGITRWINLGSRTIGYATSVYSEADDWFDVDNNSSGTIEREGLDITKILSTVDGGEIDFDDYVSGLANTLLPIFSEDDVVKIAGGGAKVDELIESIKKVFPHASAVEEPVTLQVESMLKFALDYYAESHDESEGE